MTFLETRNKFLIVCKYLLNDASYGKRFPFTKYTALKFASVGTIPETIGATVESVQQFEVKSFFETRNNCLRFVQISPKRRILRKKAPLYEIFAIKVRIDWYYSGNDWCYG